jgi:hypothetical protein
MGACFLLTKVWVPDGGVRYLLHLYTQQLSSPAKHYQPANLIASQRSVDSNIFMRIPERQSNTVDFPAATQHGTTTETWTTEHERGLQSLIRELCRCRLIQMDWIVPDPGPLRVWTFPSLKGECCRSVAEGRDERRHVQIYRCVDASVFSLAIGVARNVPFDASTDKCMNLAKN